MTGRFRAFILLTLAFATGCQDAKRQQGRALLELIEAVDIKAPPTKRRAALAALTELDLTDSDLARTRQQCVEAHHALLESEEQQARARQALDANSATNGIAAVDAQKAAAIAAALEQSNAQLKFAMSVFPRCEREVRALAMRINR
jgi:hypothetical protein